VRSFGLDVHRDFCEVAICENGRVRSAGRVQTSPKALQVFADSLAPTDQVALEATGNALRIARLLEPHVARRRRGPCRGRDAIGGAVLAEPGDEQSADEEIVATCSERCA
jgi:hypothetical protein